ncbi:MAG: hypothetical protein V3V78_01195 [Candidatus Woesearchaeota archaeon]
MAKKKRKATTRKDSTKKSPKKKTPKEEVIRSDSDPLFDKGESSIVDEYAGNQSEEEPVEGERPGKKVAVVKDAKDLAALAESVSGHEDLLKGAKYHSDESVQEIQIDQLLLDVQVVSQDVLDSGIFPPEQATQFENKIKYIETQLNALKSRSYVARLGQSVLYVSNFIASKISSQERETQKLITKLNTSLDYLVEIGAADVSVSRLKNKIRTVEDLHEARRKFMISTRNVGEEETDSKKQGKKEKEAEEDPIKCFGDYFDLLVNEEAAFENALLEFAGLDDHTRHAAQELADELEVYKEQTELARLFAPYFKAAENPNSEEIVLAIAKRSALIAGMYADEREERSDLEIQVKDETGKRTRAERDVARLKPFEESYKGFEGFRRALGHLKRSPDLLKFVQEHYPSLLDKPEAKDILAMLRTSESFAEIDLSNDANKLRLSQIVNVMKNYIKDNPEYTKEGLDQDRNLITSAVLALVNDYSELKRYKAGSELEHTRQMGEIDSALAPYLLDRSELESKSNVEIIDHLVQAHDTALTASLGYDDQIEAFKADIELLKEQLASKEADPAKAAAITMGLDKTIDRLRGERNDLRTKLQGIDDKYQAEAVVLEAVFNQRRSELEGDLLIAEREKGIVDRKIVRVQAKMDEVKTANENLEQQIAALQKTGSTEKADLPYKGQRTLLGRKLAETPPFAKPFGERLDRHYDNIEENTGSARALYSEIIRIDSEISRLSGNEKATKENEKKAKREEFSDKFKQSLLQIYRNARSSLNSMIKNPKLDKLKYRSKFIDEVDPDVLQRTKDLMIEDILVRKNPDGTFEDKEKEYLGKSMYEALEEDVKKILAQENYVHQKTSFEVLIEQAENAGYIRESVNNKIKDIAKNALEVTLVREIRKAEARYLKFSDFEKGLLEMGAQYTKRLTALDEENKRLAGRNEQLEEFQDRIEDIAGELYGLSKGEEANAADLEQELVAYIIGAKDDAAVIQRQGRYITDQARTIEEQETNLDDLTRENDQLGRELNASEEKGRGLQERTETIAGELYGLSKGEEANAADLEQEIVSYIIGERALQERVAVISGELDETVQSEEANAIDLENEIISYVIGEQEDADVIQRQNRYNAEQLEVIAEQETNLNDLITENDQLGRELNASEENSQELENEYWRLFSILQEKEQELQMTQDDKQAYIGVSAIKERQIRSLTEEITDLRRQIEEYERNPAGAGRSYAGEDLNRLLETLLRGHVIVPTNGQYPAGVGVGGTVSTGNPGAGNPPGDAGAGGDGAVENDRPGTPGPADGPRDEENLADRLGALDDRYEGPTDTDENYRGEAAGDREDGTREQAPEAQPEAAQAEEEQPQEEAEQPQEEVSNPIKAYLDLSKTIENEIIGMQLYLMRAYAETGLEALGVEGDIRQSDMNKLNDANIFDVYLSTLTDKVVKASEKRMYVTAKNETHAEALMYGEFGFNQARLEQVVAKQKSELKFENIWGLCKDRIEAKISLPSTKIKEKDTAKVLNYVGLESKRDTLDKGILINLLGLKEGQGDIFKPQIEELNEKYKTQLSRAA